MRQRRIQQERLFRPPALLADLQVPEGQMQPPFSSTNFNYTVVVPEDVNDLHVTARLALGKENDKFRVKFTSNTMEADMFGSSLVLKKNTSTALVKVHVSSHKLATSTYLLHVVTGPPSHVDDVPSTPQNHADGGPDHKPEDFLEALFSTLLLFGAAMAVSSVLVFLYGLLATLRTRRSMLVEGYQTLQ
ncbi:hypothetical protein AXG93_2528s2290 [Marchantia polymorpha subsp. ruderalis]|nr:hypothetical protein AXG93_2528s2290 [Marchantia polymorpha subsp. ruderalis]